MVGFNSMKKTIAFVVLAAAAETFIVRWSTFSSLHSERIVVTAETDPPNWRDRPIYWVVCATLVVATACVLGLWLWANRAIARDITEITVTETGHLMFGCEPDHFFGAAIWFKRKGDDPETQAIACFDRRAWKWRLKDSKDYLRQR